MIKIEDFDHNGNGIGRLNEKIVFVEKAIPGEVVDIKIIKDKKNYSEAIINNIIEQSENRIDSLCPYYNLCGGCNILHMTYDTQLKFKYNKIKNILNKYLGDVKVNDIVYSNQFNYRNKVTFKVKESIGFYKEKTYELIKIDNCLLLNNKINNLIPILNKLDLKSVKNIVVKCYNNDLMVIIDGNTNIDILKEYCKSIYMNDNLVYGDKYLIQSIGEYKYLVGPKSFFQVNDNVTKLLYDKIKSYIDSDNVLDLYCGVGSISIYTNALDGIEIIDEAILCAKENNKLNNTNVNFTCSDSSNIKNKYDIVIVDPPRSGLSKDTINNLIKIKPKKIIYVSCDPMTLVRDLKILNEHYNILEATPFDMFPNTKHVETLCVLERK